MSVGRAWFPPLACRALSLWHVRHCVAVVFFVYADENPNVKGAQRR